MNIIQIIALAVWIVSMSAMTGAFGYRMRGGPPSWPRPIEQCIYCSVYLLILLGLDVTWWKAMIAYAAAVGFVLTGHGLYFLAMSVKAAAPERFDFILKPFFGIDPRASDEFKYLRGRAPETYSSEERQNISQAMLSYGMRRLYWRCVSGLALTGFLVTLIPGFVLAFDHPIAGIFLALSGAVKGPAYAIADRFGWGTEGGEYSTGGASWTIAAVIFMVTIAVSSCVCLAVK